MTSSRPSLDTFTRFLPEILLAMLAVVGIFRPQLPQGLRAHWGGTIVALAVLGSLAYLSRARRRRDAGAVLVAVFALLLGLLYLQPQRVASDGVHYFATLHSLVVDGDLDFENEYRILGAGDAYFQPTATGHLPNTFSVGPALLWAPAYLLVHALGYLGLFRPTGFGYPYFTVIATVTAVGGLCGVLWLHALLRRYYQPAVALASALFIWLGTFHVWYMVFEPSMSHAFGMASVAGYLLLCHSGAHRTRDYVFLGLASGLVILVRWQNILFLPAGWAFLWSSGERFGWKRVVLVAGVAVAVFVPQMLFWKVIYGGFLLVPQGGTYMAWGAPQLGAVLFSSRHGLLSWSPLLWLGLIGLVAFARKAPLFAVGLLAALVLTTYVNASVHDWWAGASFGSRRFDGALVAFGLGLGIVLEWLVPRVKEHALLVVALALLPFLVWNASLMALYFGGSIPPDAPVSFGRVAADSMELLYRRTGYPFSWPAAWWTRYRSGVPLPNYDLVGAQHLSQNVYIRMGETDALYLGEGWSLPLRERDATLRQVGPPSAAVYVMLREPAPYRLILEGRSEGPVAIRFQETDLGAVELGAERGAPAELSVPRDAVAAGRNRLILTPAEGSEAFVSRLSLVRRGSD